MRRPISLNADLAYVQDPRIDVSRATLNHTDIKSALLSRKKTIADVHVYNTHLSLDPNKKVTNQKSSGRCWLFATTNVCYI